MPDDRPSFEDAFRAHWGIDFREAVDFLAQAARRLTRSGPVDPQDLTHDFLVEKVLRQPCRVEPPENPRAYLYTALARFYCDEVRRHARLPLPGTDVFEWWWAVLGADFSELVFCFWDIVDDHRFSCSFARVFPRAQARLSLQAIRLRLDRETLDELQTWEEIGDEMGCTRNTASCHFQRGIYTVLDVLEHGWREKR